MRWVLATNKRMLSLSTPLAERMDWRLSNGHRTGPFACSPWRHKALGLSVHS